jgi:hypothetical protein
MKNSNINPVMQDTEKRIESNVSPEIQDQYERIVVAGDKIMFSPKTHSNVSWLQSPADASIVADGVAELITIIDEESKGSMKMEPAIYASVTLAMHALDFVERTQGSQVTQEMADATSNAVMGQVLEKFGIGSGAGQQGAQQDIPPQVAQQPTGLIGAR